MMKHEYDVIIAGHYAAYRPPLHQLILKKCLKEYEESKFKFGLDVGCGTGQSSIALADFCERVIAIDPSPEMLVMAKSSRLISYKTFDGKNIELPEDHFDIVTFAGSLFYAKSQRLYDETIRVTKQDGLILIYDFELVMDEFQDIQESFENESLGEYDHWVDFSGLDTYGISKLFTQKDIMKISIAPEEMAHVLLAEPGVYQRLMAKNPEKNPYKTLCEGLNSRSYSELPVNIFYTLYKVVK